MSSDIVLTLAGTKLNIIRLFMAKTDKTLDCSLHNDKLSAIQLDNRSFSL